MQKARQEKAFNMADAGVEIDLYGDDLNEGFNQSVRFPMCLNDFIFVI